jgi:soluble lytic murein transglycosylase-like protein
MQRPGLRGLGGAAVAAFAFGAAVTFPSELGDAERPLPREERAHEPGPPGLVERVDLAIFARMDLEALERRTLARTIVTEAEAARIDPLLVLALIQVESSFDPAALSDRGARGLMQLREPTFRRELERHRLALADPHDPVTNVRAGVRYFRRLLDAFGREEVALMAYNAGPNRILGYLREGEIPQRFHAYPRRVKGELRRLRRSMATVPLAALAERHPLAVTR